MWAETRRAGRSDEFYIFHLGWPDISARYNAVGRFGRVSEVASRVAGQLGEKEITLRLKSLHGALSISSLVLLSFLVCDLIIRLSSGT